MTLMLYLDENIPPVLSHHLRRRGFDVLSAQEVNMLGKSDEEQLGYAFNNGRTLLTFDTDFILLSIRWLSENKHHGGIVISKEFKLEQMGELVKYCSRFLSQTRSEDVADAIFYLQQFKQ